MEIMYKISELLGTSEYELTYKVIAFLGRLNILLVIIALIPFLLRRINKYVYGYKNTTIKKLLKRLSKKHPYVGVTLVISAFIHGHLALGTLFKFHTGPLIWWVLFVMMLLVLFGGKYKIKGWLTVHRILAIVFGLSVLLHLFARNIFQS